MKPNWEKPRPGDKYIIGVDEAEEFDCWSDAYEPDPEWLKYLACAIAAGIFLGAVYVLFGDFGWGGK